MTRIGICAHPNVSADKTLAALAQIKVTRVRTDCPWNASDGSLAWCLALAKSGVTLCLSVNGWEGQPNVDAALGFVRQIVTAYPGSVDAIEGPNEVNNDPQTWAGHSDPRNGDMSQRSAAHAVQGYLDTAAKADAVLSGIPVVSYTDVVAPAVSGAADFANMHVYDNGTNGPLDWWLSVDGLGKLQKANPGTPWFVTEWGVRSDGHNSEAIQARYILQGLLTHIQMGTAAHYLYELFDDNAGPYGVFKSDGTPKAAAKMLAGAVPLLDAQAPYTTGHHITVDKATTNTGGLQFLAVPATYGAVQFAWMWNAPPKPVDLYWEVDRALQVIDGFDLATGRDWGHWSKRASERQDWKAWDGSPINLRYGY